MTCPLAELSSTKHLVQHPLRLRLGAPRTVRNWRTRLPSASRATSTVSSQEPPLRRRTLPQNPMQIHQLSGTERSPITEATRPAAGAAQRSSGKPRPRHPRCLILQRPGFGYSVHPRHTPYHRNADATAGSRRPANLSQTMRLRFRGIPLRSNSRHLIPAAGLGTEPGIHPLLQPTLHEISKSRRGDNSFHPSKPHGAYRSTLAPPPPWYPAPCGTDAPNGPPRGDPGPPSAPTSHGCVDARCYASINLQHSGP